MKAGCWQSARGSGCRHSNPPCAESSGPTARRRLFTPRLNPKLCEVRNIAILAGQAQKEAHANEAHALADAILHCAVMGELAAPPTSASEGDCWLVSASPTGAWTGHAGQIAAMQGGNWLYITPRDGMRMLDRSTGQGPALCWSVAATRLTLAPDRWHSGGY